MKQARQFLYQYRYLIILIVALASRLLLINSSIDFFDSSQYIWRSDAFSLKNALTTGHAPYHPGYIFFTYFFNQLFDYFNIHDTPFAACLPSAIFGSLTILVFYAWVEKMFKTKIALLATLLVAITPYFWISNLAILVDPTMIFFYILSLYLFYLWLKDEKYLWLILSGFSFGWAMWTHTQIAFWVLAYVGLLVMMVKIKRLPLTLIKSLLWLIGPMVFIGIYLWLLVTSGHNETYGQALLYLLGGNAGDHLPWSFWPGARNYLIIMTIFLAALAVFGLIKMLVYKTRQGLFLAIWLIPGLFISALYLYANLYGRASLMAIFPSMIAVSYLLVSWQPKNKIILAFKYLIILLAIGQLLFISLPIVKLYATQLPPYQESDQIRKSLRQGGIMVLSNLEKTLPGYDNYVVVWEMSKTKIDGEIQKSLATNKPVFIDADALRYPYFKYDGQNWEIQSTDVGGPGEHESLLAYLFTDFNFDLLKTSSNQYKTGIYQAYKNDKNLTERLRNNIHALEDGQVLIFGKVIDENTQLPVSRLMIDIYAQIFPISPQRINYNDWLYKLYNYIQRSTGKDFREPLNWAYTDKSGYFVSFVPENEVSDPIKFHATSYNLSTNDVSGKRDDVKFIQAESKELILKPQSAISGELGIDQFEKLSSLINDQQTYSLVIKKKGNKLSYQYQLSGYSLKYTDKLEAKSLAHDIGQLTNGYLVSQRGETGYLTFGPWITLPAGKYQINFKLKITDFLDKDEIGYIEVTEENSSESLAKKNLRVSDFKDENSFNNINLEFSTDGSTGVEFRTKSNGAVSIWLESIQLQQK